MIYNNQKHRRRLWRRPSGSGFSDYFTINIYGSSLYVPYILHIHFQKMFHIFSLVCFLIYGVKSRSGHDRSPTFVSISYDSGPKLTFWVNFIMILHGVAWTGRAHMGLYGPICALMGPYGPEKSKKIHKKSH